MLKTCPDADVLQRFLLGQTSDQESAELEAHLAACAHCVQTLHGMKAEDTVVEAMRAQAGTAEAEEAVVESLIERLQRLREEQPAAGEITSANLAIDFLAPAQAAGELGRLGGYGIHRILGAGGMGIVFEAEDATLGRRVAL